MNGEEGSVVRTSPMLVDIAVSSHLTAGVQSGAKTQKASLREGLEQDGCNSSATAEG